MTSDVRNHLGEVNMLALAGGAAVAQGGESAHGPVHAPGVVQVGPAPACRGLFGQTGQEGQSGEGLSRRPHGTVPVVSPGMSEARHRHVYDVGPELA